MADDTTESGHLLPERRDELRPIETVAGGVSAVLSQIPILAGVLAYYDGKA